MGNSANPPPENDSGKPVESAEEPAKATVAGLAGIATSLVEDMPEVQEHAITEATQQAQAVAAVGPVDRDGQTFNPAIHKADASGNPILSPSGTLTKKPGRKAGGANSTKSASIVGGVKSTAVATGPSQSDLQRMQCRQAGNAAANLLMTIGVIAGGDEWQPRVDLQTGLDEKTMLESAFGEYFVAAGIVDIPPGFALTIAVGGYMLPRFTMPKTKTRLQRASSFVKKWYANRKLKKHGLRSEDIDKEKGVK